MASQINAVINILKSGYFPQIILARKFISFSEKAKTKSYFQARNLRVIFKEHHPSFYLQSRPNEAIVNFHQLPNPFVSQLTLYWPDGSHLAVHSALLGLPPLQ